MERKSTQAEARPVSFPLRLLIGLALILIGAAIWVGSYQKLAVSLGIDWNRRETLALVTSVEHMTGGEGGSAYKVNYVFSVPSQGAFVGSENTSSRPRSDAKGERKVRVEYNARNPEANRLARDQSPLVSTILHLCGFVVLAMLGAPFLLIGGGAILTVLLDLKNALRFSLGKGNGVTEAPVAGRGDAGMRLDPSAPGDPGMRSVGQRFAEITLEQQGERLLIHRPSGLWIWPLVRLIFVGALLGGIAVAILTSTLTGSGEITVNGTPLSQLRPDQQRAGLIIMGGVGLLIASLLLAFVGASFFSFIQSLLQSRFPVTLDRRGGVVLLGQRRLGLLGAIRAVQVNTTTDEEGDASHTVTFLLADDQEEQQRERLPLAASKWVGAPLAAAVTLYTASAMEDWSWWHLLPAFGASYCLLGAVVAGLTFALQKLPQLFRPTTAQRLRLLGLHYLVRTQHRATADRLAQTLAEFLAVPLRRTPETDSHPCTRSISPDLQRDS